MPQTTLLKFTFCKDKKQIWLDWCQELKNRSEEVLSTLREEGVIVEGCFVSESENACYFLMEANDLTKVQETYEKSNRPIDIQNRQRVEEALVFTERLKTAYYFRGQ